MGTQGRKRMMIFSGSSNAKLGREIAEHLNLPLGRIKLTQFSNGEIYVKFLESVRGADVFVVQTLSTPVNMHFMELLIMIDALKRASAGTITAVVPHYAYARQDKKTTAREPITAKLIADLLTTAGIDRLVSMDLHAGQIQGFFDMPVDHLTAVPILAGHFEEKALKDLVVVSPDVGRVKVAKKYADILGAPLAIMHKSRPQHNVAEVTHVIGDVEGRTALLIDDMIDTAGTIVEGAKALMDRGATEVYACATHPVFSGPAVERLTKSPLKEIAVTNTIPVPEEKQMDKLRVLSIAPLFAHAILNVYEDESVSELFDQDFQL
ncbi:MAG: ribose-phosphate diphosphokinase [Actinobacteria bacterium]|nr:MAG: ribose-phosphate diphosphokinase [Actinomycetota bacterium]